MGHLAQPRPRPQDLRRRGATATRILSILRPVAVAAATVNLVSTFIGAFSTDPRVFVTGLIGAALSTYGWLFFTEEAELMEGTRTGYRDVAMRLRWELKEEGYQPGQRLPTMKVLAARFGVTRRTIGRAIDVLAAENLVEVIVGRGCYVVGLKGDKPRDRVHKHILNNISTGYYLPSAAKIAGECEVSPATVRRVMAQLVRQGVLTKNSGRHRKA